MQASAANDGAANFTGDCAYGENRAFEATMTSGYTKLPETERGRLSRSITSFRVYKMDLRSVAVYHQ